MKKTTLTAITLAMASILSACGGSGDGSYIPSETIDTPGTVTPSDPVAEKPALTGYFGYKVENLRYRSVSSNGLTYEGRTGDLGDFKYNKDDLVTFYLGDFKLGYVVNERFVSPANFDPAIALMGGEIPTSSGIDLSGCETSNDTDSTDTNAETSVDTETLEQPPQCVDNFPESGVSESTKVMFSALFDANRDVDNEILEGMYIDKDESDVADSYYDAGLDSSESHDYLGLLSRYSLAPKAGKYTAEITADTQFGENGTTCLAGNVSLELTYSDSVDMNSGSLSLEKMTVKGTPVYGYEELRSRNIYGAFTFVPEPYVDQERDDVENDFTYNISLDYSGHLIGSYIDNINNCSGTIVPAK